jgi:O-antigen/teichoic acid export membrane protein
MDKTYRVLTALLLSFVIVASIIMFTVGVEQSHLGSERKWMYPLVFVLIPAFVLQSVIRYLFRRKNQITTVMKKSPTSKGGSPTGEA